MTPETRTVNDFDAEKDFRIVSRLVNPFSHSQHQRLKFEHAICSNTLYCQKYLITFGNILYLLEGKCYVVCLARAGVQKYILYIDRFIFYPMLPIIL